MSTREEIRQQHLVDGIPLKTVARNLGVNVKTVRRHVASPEDYPKRKTPSRGRTLDPHRNEIIELIQQDKRISAKRIGRIIEERHGLRMNERTIRRYVQDVRGTTTVPENFVHRTHIPGETMEIDFGESWAIVAGRKAKIFFFVATLPASNAYFAKAYEFQRIECLLDGITSAIENFGGLPSRVVFDNASMAVKVIGLGSKREETEIFSAYRSEWPLRADFCAPASGWEKGSVEKGVEYVRGLGFRPMPNVQSIDQINATLRHELELDLDRRKLRDGRTAREALDQERGHLRSLPAWRPPTCRVISCSVNKYAHVQVDRSTYSVPSELARKTVTVKLFHDRVEIVYDGSVVANHARSLVRGEYVLALDHVIDVLLKKPRAAQEATVIRQLGLPPCFDELRDALRCERRHSDRKWVEVIELLCDHSLDALTAAVEESLASGAPGVGTIRQILRRHAEPRLLIEPVRVEDETLREFTVPAPNLADWDVLHHGVPA